MNELQPCTRQPIRPNLFLPPVDSRPPRSTTCCKPPPGSHSSDPDGPSGVGGTLVYFMCEDCAVEAARVVPSGGSVMKEKFAIDVMEVQPGTIASSFGNNASREPNN
ncbi:hypothetical protein D9M68_161470 [compost metagenome]